MWNVENNNNNKIVNPIESDGDFIFVPVEQDEEIEREILEKRTAHGRVRWFNRAVGYGFLREDGNCKEIFVHQSAIQVPGVKMLRPGQRVLFECCQLQNGEMALNVIPIEEKPEKLAKYAQNA